MKTNIIFLSVLFLLIAGSIVSYTYMQKSKQPVVVQGNASFPEIKKEEIIQQSDTIVIAQVKSQNSFKAPSEIRENNEDVITNVTLSIEKYLRNYNNNSFQEIIVQTLGGTVENLTMNFEGTPTFKDGERVIVFLKKKNNNVFTVYGWAQGKYSISSDGEVGMGEQELSYFQNVFGSNLTLAEIENQIDLFKNIPPKNDISNLDYSLENQNGNVNDKNSEANSVLEKSIQIEVE